MLSNFTIKQAIPRLIIAAIAINLSYWICALLVDLSNVMGGSVFKLLQQLGVQALDASALDTIVGLVLAGGTAAAGVAAAGGVIAHFGIIGTITAAIAASGAGTQILLGLGLMVVSAVLGIALAIFIALLILATRQALVIILIIVAPIAFALYILPGTKSIFEKWRKLFTTMLVFYPLFSLLYGGALLAASVLISASGNSNSPAPLRMVLLLMGMLAQFAPFLLTPWLMIKGSKELGDLGRKLMQQGRRATSMPGRFGRKMTGEGSKLVGTGLQRRFKDYAATRPDNRRGRLLRGLAYAGVRREKAKEEAESAIKRLNTEYAHGHSGLEASHMRTMENEETTAALEAKGKAEAIASSPGLQTAIGQRKQEELGASRRRGIIETTAEAQHRDSSTGTLLTANEGVAKKTLDRVNKAESALTEELSSEKGQLVAASKGLDRQIAVQMQDESRQSRIQAERVAAAQRVNDAAFDTYIDSATPQAAADAKVSAGIDPTGVTRIKAIATKRIEGRLMEAVDQEKSTQTSTSEADLIKVSLDLSKSLETRMAAAGTVSGRGNFQAKMDLLESLNQEMIKVATPIETRIRAANTQNAGESNKDYMDRINSLVDSELVDSKDPQVTAIRHMQKQAISDMREVPFGVGDQMRGNMGLGVSRQGFFDSFKDRLRRKLKGTELTKLRPEEVKFIVETIDAEPVGSPYALGLQAAIDDALASADVRANIKKETKEELNTLLASGRIARGFKLEV